jgi:hypothetical protein
MDEFFLFYWVKRTHRNVLELDHHLIIYLIFLRDDVALGKDRGRNAKEGGVLRSHVHVVDGPGLSATAPVIKDIKALEFTLVLGIIDLVGNPAVTILRNPVVDRNVVNEGLANVTDVLEGRMRHSGVDLVGNAGYTFLLEEKVPLTRVGVVEDDLSIVELSHPHVKTVKLVLPQFLIPIPAEEARVTLIAAVNQHASIEILGEGRLAGSLTADNNSQKSKKQDAEDGLHYCCSNAKMISA